MEAVFRAGVLLDVGMVAMSRALGPSYGRLVAAARCDDEDLARLERDEYGVDHAAVGATLAAHWGMPSDTVEAIAAHHDTTAGRTGPLSRTLAVAARVAVCLSPDPTPPVFAAGFEPLRHAIGGTDEERIEWLSAIDGRARVWSSWLGVEIGDAFDGSASAHLLTPRGNSDGTAADRPQPDTGDGAGSVLSARQFDEILSRTLARAAGVGRRVALMRCDVDGLGAVNNAVGHLAGDAVLARVGRQLSSAVADRGVVARGRASDGAFWIMIPDIPRADAAVLAEAVRAAIERRGVVIGRLEDRALTEVTSTVSLGVAMFDDMTHHTVRNTAQFRRLAHTALQVAKSRGGNQVRVYVPRSASQDVA